MALYIAPEKSNAILILCFVAPEKSNLILVCCCFRSAVCECVYGCTWLCCCFRSAVCECVCIVLGVWGCWLTVLCILSFVLQILTVIVLFLPWPIGAMPLHVQHAYYIVHALALAKLTCAVLYSTCVAREVAWYLLATVLSLLCVLYSTRSSPSQAHVRCTI